MHLDDLRSSFPSDAVERELIALAKEKPLFRYTDGNSSCFYDRGPFGGLVCDGCIFGQAFQRLGVEKIHSISDLIEGCPPRWTDVQSSQDAEAVAKLA